MNTELKNNWAERFRFFFLICILSMSQLQMGLAAGENSSPQSSRCKDDIKKLLVSVGENSWALRPEEYKKIRPGLQRSVVDNAVKVILAKESELENVDLQFIFELVWTDAFADFKFQGPWWSTHIFDNPTSLARQIFVRLDKDRDFQKLKSSDRAKKKLNIRRLLYFWLPAELPVDSMGLKAAWQFEAARAALEFWDSEKGLVSPANVEVVVGVTWDRLVGRGDFATGASGERLRIFDNESQFYGFVFSMRERDRARKSALKAYDLRGVEIQEPSSLIKEALAQLRLRDPK